MRRVRLFLVDAVLVVIATVAALLLRDNFEPSSARLVALMPYLGATLVAAAFVFPALGISRTIWRFTALKDYLRLLAAAGLTVAAAVALAFGYNRLDDVARAVPVLQAMLMLVCLVGARVVMRLRHTARTKPVQLVESVDPASMVTDAILVVGLTRLTELYLRSVAELAAHRVNVAGLLVANPQHAGRSVHNHKVLGSPVDVTRVIRDLEAHGVIVDRIVVTGQFDHMPEAERDALLHVERASGIRLEFLVEQLGLDGPTKDVESSSEGNITFLISDAELAAMARRPYWRIKRGLDLVGAYVLLLLAAPFMVCAGMLILLDVGWPIAFWQQRPGLKGRPFRLYKLRTMTAAHLADGRRVPEGQRASPIGRALRRLRMDELPQLFNILRGEMSFVGPRPLLPADQPTAYAARLLVRPGLTGWAQVKGGREISAANKAALDVWYVKNASLRLDAIIVAQTVRMLVRGERISHSAIREAWTELRRAGISAHV